MATRRICARVSSLSYGQESRATFRLSHPLSQSSSLYTTALPDIRPASIIFSGIQPTGVPHLGNYLGALREWVRLQDRAPVSSRLIFSIVDLHALTVPQEPSELRRRKSETLAILLAIGLDPERCTIFYQSAVPAHAELMWILSTVASVGYLSRMTQWKSKLHLPEDTDIAEASKRSALRLGLFSYPILQAADILVHRATHVPVGSDQSQHVEFTRYTAKSFNHLYGDIFPIPETVLSPSQRIKSLRVPKLKMSKSDPDSLSRILLTDSPDEINKKIRLAVTDSESNITYDPDRRPGVSNLLDILSSFDPDHRSAEELSVDFRYASMKAFKEHVARTLAENLRDIRERYLNLMMNHDGHLERVAAIGRQKAVDNAERTMQSIRTSMGL